MRRFSAIAAVVIITLLFSVFSAAAVTQNIAYEAPDYTITLSVPDSMYLISGNVKMSDSLFYEGKFDYISTMTKMRTDDAVFYGRDNKDTYEIEVTVSENNYGIKNLSKLSQKKLIKTSNKFSADNEYSVCRIYKTGPNTFVYGEYKGIPSSRSDYVYSYTTVFNGDDIAIKMLSKRQIDDAAQLKILRDIVNTVELPQKAPLSLATLEGRGTLVMLIVITLGFVGVIFYRRNEEFVNEKIGFAATAVVGAVRTVVKNREEKAVSQPTVEEHTGESPPAAEEDKAADEEEDLSEIDLDEAIAAFDDGSIS